MPNWLIFILFVVTLMLCYFYIPAYVSTGPLMVVLAVWLLSLGTVANNALPEGQDKSIIKLQLALGYGCLYTLIFEWFIYDFNGVVIPFHLLAVFCMFYSLYFVATRLKSAESGKTATFSDAAAIFMGLWFFPAGVWFVQPKANRIVKASLAEAAA